MVWRFYSDHLMPSRMAQYEAFLHFALNAGYTIYPVKTFWKQVQAGQIPEKSLILRHDIDLVRASAQAMWEIEARLGVQSSYFFRLKTLDVPLMQRIHAGGGEASYHYEELATYIKRQCLRTTAHIQQHLPAMQAEFRSNLSRLRTLTGLPMDVVASHGDFINRRLGVPNWVMLQDVAFRQEMGIALEVYDPALQNHIQQAISDARPPHFWHPVTPFESIQAGVPIISVLVHSWLWQTHARIKFRDNLQRVWQGWQYGRC